MIAQADSMAVSYDYDGAAELLKASPLYAVRTDLQQKVTDYEAQKAACVAITPEEVTHIFYHSLIVDPDRGFAGDDSLISVDSPAARALPMGSVTMTWFLLSTMLTL